jgi:hypothetical protein
MPPKKSQAKSASEAKKTKSNVKKIVPKEKKEEKKKENIRPAKTITIDVISDDDEAMFASNQSEKAEKKLSDQDIEKIDVQKKYYHELIAKNQSNTHSVEDEKPYRNRPLKLYRKLAINFFILVAFFLLIVLYFTLTKLTIIIYPATETITDSINFQISENSNDAQVVPGEISEKSISVEKRYSSSGEENIGEEIVGSVIIYNNYTQNQPLVATTRLLSPDEKLFRIKERVDVPAGSQVEVEIYADEVSQDMAIEPTTFTIPGLWLGLQDRIYAESKEPFEYKGKVRPFVKQSDIDNATNDIRNTLKEKLEQELTWQNRPGTAVAYQIDESRSLYTIQTDLGEEIESFIAKAENKAIIASFSQEKAQQLLQAKLAFRLPKEKSLVNFNTDQISYSLNSYDLDNNSAQITARYIGSVVLDQEPDFLDKKQLAGLNEGQLEEFLKLYPEIDSFELKFFPGFLKRAPNLADRIKIEIRN